MENNMNVLKTAETIQGTVKKPKVVCDYNHTMGRVDNVDQQLVDYPIPRKRGKKYYKKIFFYLMDIAVWNDFILHQETSTQSEKKPNTPEVSSANDTRCN